MPATIPSSFHSDQCSRLQNLLIALRFCRRYPVFFFRRLKVIFSACKKEACAITHRHEASNG